jgi:hypothetical protein
MKLARSQLVGMLISFVLLKEAYKEYLESLHRNEIERARMTLGPAERRGMMVLDLDLDGDAPQEEAQRGTGQQSMMSVQPINRDEAARE